MTTDDTGPGLAEGVRARVFERFYHPNDNASGSGLGLAIVKLLVELNGKHVEVSNAQEGRAVFKVLLPGNTKGSTHVIRTETI